MVLPLRALLPLSTVLKDHLEEGVHTTAREATITSESLKITTQVTGTDVIQHIHLYKEICFFYWALPLELYVVCYPQQTAQLWSCMHCHSLLSMHSWLRVVVSSHLSKDLSRRKGYILSISSRTLFWLDYQSVVMSLDISVGRLTKRSTTGVVLHLLNLSVSSTDNKGSHCECQRCIISSAIMKVFWPSSHNKVLLEMLFYLSFPVWKVFGKA